MKLSPGESHACPISACLSLISMGDINYVLKNIKPIVNANDFILFVYFFSHFSISISLKKNEIILKKISPGKREMQTGNLRVKSIFKKECTIRKGFKESVHSSFVLRVQCQVTLREGWGETVFLNFHVCVDLSQTLNLI